MKAKERLLKISNKLEKKYGKIPWKSHGDPLDLLILTILSQNTNDVNRDRAYEALNRKYSSYQQIIDAPLSELADTIRVGGLNQQKAKRIQQVLKDIRREQGKFSLDYLKKLSRDDALVELLKHNGVGKKTAGIVLTFSLNKPYFPVDTHITRITQRLGLVKKNQDPHDVMNELVPEKLTYQLHMHLITHGRETCKARKPLCDRCVIREFCPFPKKALH
ncbi:endonuclease III [Candidatus Acetothermia bacterium]|nr:endonuclease III [Candidatus Acetothermia bacterium]MBI3643773.1 endonuclease III [Candidatus Acetothermia bacterium]